VHTDIFSPKTTFDRSSRFSFGVDRLCMKKCFVEESLHKAAQTPAPGDYRQYKNFEEVGIKQSIRPRLERYGKRVDDYSDYYRKLQKNLPGPGYYKTI
jgi:hypothetical protein